MVLRSLLRMSLTDRSRANAAQALYTLRAHARDSATAQRVLEQADRKLAVDQHPSFARTPRRP